MSLLSHRAIDDRVESTFSARSPAEARAWFVRLTSCCSEPELKVLTLQASVVRGAAKSPTAVRANATAVIAANRRGSWGRRPRNSGKPGSDRGRAGTTIMASEVSCVTGWGVRWGDRRRRGGAGPGCDGPGRTAHRYQRPH